MALRFALLIALQECEQTGYELTKQFDETLGFFWHGSHQQIYQELKKMTEMELVAFKEVEQEGRPDKKVYHVTDKGMTTLDRWLREPVKHMQTKDALLMKIYAAPLGSPRHLLNEVKRLRMEHEQLLVTFHEIEKQWFSPLEDLPLPYRYNYLTLRNGIIYSQGWLKWSDEVIEFLETQVNSES